jgi:hypothetical protein
MQRDQAKKLAAEAARIAGLKVIECDSDPNTTIPEVDGIATLERVSAYIRRFVSLSDAQLRVVTLWAVHTHIFSVMDATPYLAVTSAEKQSGKTRLLEVLETLVASPWLTGRVTAAVLYRKIDSLAPTLLLDESDAAFGSEKEYAEALRGILNTGHRRGGQSSCCTGQGANISFKDFSTFCPKAIAGIGKLPDTVADRSIPILLKRALPNERIERFREREIKPEADTLRKQIVAWITTIAEKLPPTRPGLPEALTDRQQDGAEPLLALADFAGGAWPEAARGAVVLLCTQAQADDDSIGQRLLVDIRAIFEERGIDRIPSTDLADALADIETSPWGEWSKGKPLSKAKLARMLGKFGITPEVIRIAEKIHRGYTNEQFLDAFRRYLRVLDTPEPSGTPSQSVTTLQPAPALTISDISKCNGNSGVTLPKREIPNENGPSYVVTLSNHIMSKSKVEEPL